ncbi:MAG: hypothetical protein SV598_12975, partial [Pseudomonadota bacterium]|nr:hypothetical protein [Pseudomonadota bacterium]
IAIGIDARENALSRSLERALGATNGRGHHSGQHQGQYCSSCHTKLLFQCFNAPEPAIPALFISYTQPHAKTLRRKQKLLVLHPMFDACGKGTKMGF